MSSSYAVAGQLAISASNYLVFVLMARLLASGPFVAFSTSVGLNMLAIAIAEGGVSYVAPRELSTREGRAGGETAGALVAMSCLLYLLTMVAGYFLWNLFAPDPLDARWVSSYAAWVLPTLLIPSWVTCWALDLFGITGLFLARGTVVLAVGLTPRPLTLALAGGGFLLFSIGLLRRLNSSEPIVTWPTWPSMRSAVRTLSGVFFAKTISYGMYGLAPLVVGIFRGSYAASDFIVGERLKGLYATLFQPLVQIGYLSQFRPGAERRARILATWVQVLNVIACVALLLLIRDGGLGFMGDSFQMLSDSRVYVIAAAFSVASSVFLYFWVFPSGSFDVFRSATFTQALAFGATFVAVAFVAPTPVAWILGVGEAALLLVLVGARVRGRRGASPEWRAGAVEEVSRSGE